MKPWPATPARRFLPMSDAASRSMTARSTSTPPARPACPRPRSSTIAALMTWSHWFAGMMDTGPHDRMYNCLPLYHSVGGVVATGAVLAGGGSVVIAREILRARNSGTTSRAGTARCFSTSASSAAIWSNAPPHAKETAHRMRLCCGNGLRPDVWEAFKTRFRIPQILEFYAATEGNFSLFNVEGKPGAIGRIPPFLDAPLSRRAREGRRSKGASRCATRTVSACAARRTRLGEAIGRISEGGGNGGGRFDGYTSRAETREEDSAQRLRARRRVVLAPAT